MYVDMSRELGHVLHDSWYENYVTIKLHLIK